MRPVNSLLGSIGTTIFTVMSALAVRHGSINLGQGFPDTDGPPDVLKAAASGSDLTTVPVSAWMTKDPQAAGPGTPVEEAAQIMLLNGFRHLPIVDGRRVHGVVSLRDLFSARISRPPQQGSAAS